MYKLARNPVSGEVNYVTKLEGNVLYSIPFDPANTDYQAYLRWLEEGNTPLPADEPEPEPAPELTAAEKLANAGLTVEELKSLLGL